MYHGAEHKCINCIENGLILTPENVKNSSRFHKRCGTSFLFLVMFISIIFFIFIRVDNTALQIVIRVLLIPVIAGVSYEVIRLAGKSDGTLINIVSKPGIWMQHLTTKEPDMDMIEVAIKAVEAVFDWKAFLLDYYKDSDNPFEAMEAKEIEVALTSSLMSDNKNIRTIKTKDLKKKHGNVHSQEARINVNSMDFMQDKVKPVYKQSNDYESTKLDSYIDNEDNSIEEEDVLAGFEIEKEKSQDDKTDNEIVDKNNIKNVIDDNVTEDDGIEFLDDVENENNI